ncbi:MAG: FG-GAP-like repeat-containing protein, partial [Candidatus Eisenbacteria bacterium]
ANQAPRFDPVTLVSLRETEPVELPLQATDQEGEALTFVLQSGPSFAAVLTTDPGSGTATGMLTLTPGYADSGSYVAAVSVSDPFHTVTRDIRVQVENVNRTPAFTVVPMPMVPEGSDAEYAVSVVDPDRDALALRIASGPPYMTLGISSSDYGFISAVLRFRPGYFDAGMTTAALEVSDGAASAEQVVEIMIRNVNRSPAIAAPDTIAVAEGEPVAFTALAPDPDGEMVMLTATGLPEGATFVDAMSNRADFRWLPRYDQAGSYAVTLEADDRQGGFVTHHLGISVAEVSAAVALAAPWGMRLAEGQVEEQPLFAFDADASPLTFSLVSGPAYLSVGTTAAGSGNAVGFVRAAPGFSDAGIASATVAAGDGVATAERTFAIEVIDAPPGVTPGGPPYAPPFPTVATGQTPHTVTMADLDRDGHLDLVVAAMNSNAVSIYLGAGDGTFGMRRDFATAVRVHTVIARDLNGDGIPDLSVSNVGSNSVGSMLGLGDGAFGPRRDFPIGGSPLFLGVGDFDRDGVPDYAVTDQTNGELVILRGAGDGTFAVTGRYTAAAGSHGLAVADLNGDGALDVAVANDGAHVVTIHLGRGDGTFDAARRLEVGEPHTVAAGDLDEDGILDLIVSNYHHGTVSICHGHGDGEFTEIAELATGADAHASLVADLDADGHPELVVANQAAGTVSFFMGRGGGVLTPKVDFPVGLGAHSLIAADYNEDGALDIALSSLFSNTVTLLLHKNSAPIAIAARAFIGPEDHVLVLRAEKPSCRVYVEAPVGAPSFALDEIDPASVRLEMEAGEGAIAPVTGKRVVLADRDRNGLPEAAFDFARSDLRALMAGVVGRSVVEAVVTGALEGGRRFRAPLILTVIGAGRSGPPVTVAPNPLNPEGVISFETKTAGRVRVMVIDVQGRTVARLHDSANAAAGIHRIALRPGRKLASGIYFVRVETPEGVRSVRFAVLK